MAPPNLVGDIDRLLGAFGVANVRLSLVAIAAPGVPLDTLTDAARAALAPSHLVGMLPDGSVGVLYVGPREGGAGADRAVVNDVARRVREALAARAPTDGERPLHLRAIHRWTDEIENAADLIAALPRIPARQSFVASSLRDVGLPSQAVAPGPPRSAPLARSSSRRQFWLLLAIAAAGTVTVSTTVRAAETRGALSATVTATTLSTIPPPGAGAPVVIDAMREMDAKDRARLAEALTKAANGADVAWRNPRTGIRYTVFLVKTERQVDGSNCRAFTVTAIAGNIVQQAYRTHCHRAGEERSATSSDRDQSSAATARKGTPP